jgi:hypothetical protein
MTSAACAPDQISTEQFRYLGTRQMVYLKVGMRHGERIYVIYSADGSLLDVVDDLDTAMERAALIGLKLVSVH